jgi:hypothetical protein
MQILKLLFNFSEFFTTKVLIPEGQDPENTVCQKLDDGQQATLRSRLPVKNSTSSKFPINPKKKITLKAATTQCRARAHCKNLSAQLCSLIYILLYSR